MSKSERFRIESGVRKGYVMSTWLFNAYMDAVMKKVKMGAGRMGVRFLEEGRECILTDLFRDLKVMVGRFVEAWRRRGLKV